MKIHQSDLKSWVRCGEQHRRQRAGDRGEQLSRTAYGSVMHHALHTLERTRDPELAKRTFDHFWHPLNIEEICEPVTVWIARDSYGTMRRNGLALIDKYWELKQYDDEEVLALEIPFAVPIEGTRDPLTGEPHVLLGTIDRLSLRSYKRELHVCIDDWKTGKKPAYLPFNVQFTAYGYATTRREFWLGNPDFLTEGFGGARGEQLYQRLIHAPRHGWWIDLSGQTPRWTDAGVRNSRDYQRFFYQADQYARAVQNDIFPLNVDGSTCQWCPFRDDCPEGIAAPSQKAITR